MFVVWVLDLVRVSVFSEFGALVGQRVFEIRLCYKNAIKKGAACAGRTCANGIFILEPVTKTSAAWGKVNDSSVNTSKPTMLRLILLYFTAIR